MRDLWLWVGLYNSHLFHAYWLMIGDSFHVSEQVIATVRAPTRWRAETMRTRIEDLARTLLSNRVVGQCRVQKQHLGVQHNVNFYLEGAEGPSLVEKLDRLLLHAYGLPEDPLMRQMRLIRTDSAHKAVEPQMTRSRDGATVHDWSLGEILADLDAFDDGADRTARAQIPRQADHEGGLSVKHRSDPAVTRTGEYERNPELVRLPCSRSASASASWWAGSSAPPSAIFTAAAGARRPIDRPKTQQVHQTPSSAATDAHPLRRNRNRVAPVLATPREAGQLPI